MIDKQIIFLYGPPASGKSTLAKQLAGATGGIAVDLDEQIVSRTGMTIADFFRKHGEEAFRDRERETLEETVAKMKEGIIVVALGGGTLLDEGNRRLCEASGAVLCLDAPDDDELERRIKAQKNLRPLGNKAQERAEHYASFQRRIAATFTLPDSLVLVGTGIANDFLPAGHAVFDETVAGLYPNLSNHRLATIPSGEQFKTPDAVMRLWHAFGKAGLGRKDCVIACGGGVTGDLTGFAAATWMRGINWINVPTTLLAMVDASVGGKTGCDLHEGKNLVGAFHSPKLVIIDTDFLKTLPEREWRSGRAEMIKHLIIGGIPNGAPEMLDGAPSARAIAKNLAVKVAAVEHDPRETLGARILLNCGHTVAHAIETASEYSISHGEAVAIGCVQEARIAVKRGLASENWPGELADVFKRAGLPTELPDSLLTGGLASKDFTLDSLIPLMKRDKKCQGGTVAFALPCGWSDVRVVKIKLD